MSVYRLPARTTFGFSPENPTGVPGGGSRGKDCEKLHAYYVVEPGQTITLMDADGPGMITNMWFGGYSGHSFIFRAFWENQEFPSVEAPLSAFFGCAYDENVEDENGNYLTFNSALMLVAPSRSMNSYFDMPFRKHARLTLENRGTEPQYLFYTISGWYGDVEPDAGYFHAVYRQEHPVTKGKAYTVVENVQGRGAFIGITLASGMNGANTCWVEGEAKMYLDGDQYPTMNYTGTEDYFLGSFAFGNDQTLHKYQPYQGLYGGMFAVLGDMQSQYNHQRRFLLYRWHVKDPVYFEQSFTMKLDNLGWTGPRYDDYTSVAYYYLDKPARLPHQLPSNDEMVMK